MRKYFFLWSAIILGVLVLVLAFENIFLVQQYFVLFFTFNSSTTVIILLSAVLGFFVGFFAMLYSFEVRKQKSQAEESDLVGTSPLETIEESKPEVDHSALQEKEKEPIRPDGFDEDDEVLG